MQSAMGFLQYKLQGYSFIIDRDSISPLVDIVANIFF